MNNIFNSGDLNVKYVSQPGLKGEGDDGIITFSRDGATTGDTSKAMLMNTAGIQFSRNVSRQYFLNTNGVAYIVGIGQGSLTISGLLGKAEDFASVFGASMGNYCGGLFTVRLDVSGMRECTGSVTSTEPNNGIIELGSVIPVGINIGANIQQDGTLYYSASASFMFTRMSMGNWLRRTTTV